MEYLNIVDDKDEREALNIIDTLGKRQPHDAYIGDVNLRTLRTLLTMIDERGWERYVYALLALRFSHARFTLSLALVSVLSMCLLAGVHTKFNSMPALNVASHVSCTRVSGPPHAPPS
tara:strand:+ start:1518 stop:1871 length:354 start_codon:yes stop_codon:yes gene_type:complete